MPPGTFVALITVRIPAGSPQPTEEALRAAIERDRTLLGVPPAAIRGDLAVAGPYRITIDGEELDEYVVWER